MFTIRRHLSKGAQFGHFQVRGYKSDAVQGDVIEYVNPTTHKLIMRGCRLYVNEKLATRIFTGEQKKKKPCAYVICESFEVVPNDYQMKGDELEYNPRKSPNWVTGGEVVNGQTFDTIHTEGARVYISHQAKTPEVKQLTLI
jgi:hypothetical protein